MLDFEAAVWKVMIIFIIIISFLILNFNLIYYLGMQGSFSPDKDGRCSFHLTQSFYRNIKSIGLGPAYRKDSQTRKTCRELLSLYLLPAKKIKKGFFLNQGKCNPWAPPSTLLRLHFKSVHRQHHLATRDLEHVYATRPYQQKRWGYAQQLESCCWWVGYCKQSNIFTFIHFCIVLGPDSINLITFLIKMKTEADKISMTAKLKQALRWLNKVAESKQSHLTTLWDNCNRADHPLSSLQLLEELGKITKKFSKADLRAISGAEEDEL